MVAERLRYDEANGDERTYKSDVVSCKYILDRSHDQSIVLCQRGEFLEKIENRRCDRRRLWPARGDCFRRFFDHRLPPDEITALKLRCATLRESYREEKNSESFPKE